MDLLPCVALMQGQLAEALASLDMQVIETPAKHRLGLAAVLNCVAELQMEEGEDEDEAEARADAEADAKASALLSEARQQLGMRSSPFPRSCDVKTSRSGDTSKIYHHEFEHHFSRCQLVAVLVSCLRILIKLQCYDGIMLTQMPDEALQRKTFRVMQGCSWMIQSA